MASREHKGFKDANNIPYKPGRWYKIRSKIRRTIGNMIIRKKAKRRDGRARPKLLSPVQELYVEIVKYNFEVMACEVTEDNNVVIDTRAGPGYEYSRHILKPS